MPPVLVQGKGTVGDRGERFDLGTGILRKWPTSLWYGFGLHVVSGSLDRRLYPVLEARVVVMKFCHVDGNTVIKKIMISIYQTTLCLFFYVPGVVPEREGKMAKDDDQARRQIGR